MLSMERDYHLRRELSIPTLMILWMFRICQFKAATLNIIYHG